MIFLAGSGFGEGGRRAGCYSYSGSGPKNFKKGSKKIMKSKKKPPIPKDQWLWRISKVRKSIPKQ
jgi:hypothetical protein